MVTDHSFPQGSGTTNWPLTCSSSARQLRARSLPKDAVPLAGFCCRLRIDCSIAIARGSARNRRKRQTVKRASLVVTLCAALCVSAGFAATKKSHRNNGPRDWNDLSLQNGDLSDSGSSVSTDGNVPGADPGGGSTGGSGSWSVPWYMSDFGISRGTNPGVANNGRHLGEGNTGRGTSWIDYSSDGGGGRIGNLINSNDQNISTGRNWNPGGGGPFGNPGNVLYSNGPANGQTDAWVINYGYTVSNSFRLSSGSTAGGFDFYVWMAPGDTLQSVGWSITSNPTGGTTYGSGTAGVVNKFLYTNVYGYNIYEESVSGLNLALGGGTFWLNLQNGVISDGDPVFWDENSGIGCSSPGCPSQAYETYVGTIPSEAFDITGTGGSCSGGLGCNDNWQGGTGHWSVAGNWDNGVPNNTGTSSFDVVINSGQVDVVTLDMNATIDSLTLGSMATLQTDNVAPRSLTVGSDFATGYIDNAGTIAFDNGSTLTLDVHLGSSSIVNSGNIQLTSALAPGASLILSDGGNGYTIMLSGGGTVTLGGASNAIMGAFGTETLNNVDNTIQGSGTIGNLGLINGGTILANGATPLTISPSSLGFQNNGTLSVASGSTMIITGGPFLNLDIPDSTLNGGTYNVAGTLQIDNANIAINNANITLSGASALISDQFSNNALAGLQVNNGSLTLQNGANLTTTVGLINNGTLMLQNTHSMTVGGDLANNGTVSLQSADMTTAGSFNNSSTASIKQGSTLTANADPSNTGNIFLNGSAFAVNGDFSNSSSYPGYYCYYGYTGCVDASNGSTFTVNGNVTNTGGITADLFGGGGGNTINIFGSLTNNYAGFVDVEGGSMLMVSGDVNNAYYLTTGYFGNGGGNTIGIGGNLNNTGYVYLYDGGNTLTIAGDFNNSGTLSTSGGSNTIDIGGALNNSGTFYLTGAGDTATANTLNNTGYLYVGSGATLAIMNQPNGIGTDVPFGASYNILGTFTTNGGSPFANVTTIEGALNLANGQTTSITPNGGTLSITGYYYGGYYCYYSYAWGCLDSSNGSTININGDVNNSGGLTAGLHGTSGTLNVFGTLTNSGYGFVDVEGGSTLTVSGDVNNFQSLFTDYFGYGAGNTISIGGNLNNSGTVDLYYGGNNLTIGGDLNNSGYVATYYGGNNTITIGGALNNSGDFELQYSGDAATANTINNTGYLYVASGASLTIANQPNGIGTDVPLGATYYIDGTFTTSGGNPFANVTTIEGSINLGNGQTTTMTPNGGTLTITGYSSYSYYCQYGYAYGCLDASNGTTININGSVNNSGELSTSLHGTGGNTLNITGDLTNSGYFELLGSGDNATANTLNNTGYLSVASGATLTILNQPNGIGTDVPYGATYDINGTFTTSGGNPFATVTTIEGAVNLGNGQTTSITPNGGTLSLSGYGYYCYYGYSYGCLDSSNGSTININGDVNNGGGVTAGLHGSAATMNIFGSLTNSGYVDVERGSTLTITGDVTNSGYLTTSYFGLGGGNTLNIDGTLTNNSLFGVYGSGDVANVGTLVNNATLYIGTGATLNLTTQLNVTDIPVNTAYEIYGTFNAGGTNAFAMLTSIEGTLYLGNSQTTDITPIGGTLTNSGNFAIGNGTTVSITGDVLNNNLLTTGYYVGGGNNNLTISGTLTNNSTFYVDGSGDMANVGMLNNNGYTLVGPHATLNLTNQPNGITDAAAGSEFVLQGTFTAGGNNGFANLTSIEGAVYLENGAYYGINTPTTITPTGGTLTISHTGSLDASYGAGLQINGSVDNSGILSTSRLNYLYGYYSGPDTINITGTLTNEAGAQFNVNGNYYFPDVANVGNLNNLGNVYVGPYATLNIGNPGGITDVVAGSQFTIAGTFNAGGSPALANLTSIEGNLYLQTSPQYGYYTPTSITPNGGTLTISNTGSLDASYGAGLQVNGNVDNSGQLSTGRFNYLYGNYYGPDTLSITGTLTNEAGGAFNVNGNYYYHDVANVGALNNMGSVLVGPYGTLNLTNQPNGITDVVGGSQFEIQGAFNAGGNNAFSNLTSIEGNLYLQTSPEYGYTTPTSITPNGGTLTISSTGSMDASYGAGIQVNGNVDNSGMLSTSRNDYLYDQWYGPSNINISGGLTNEAGGAFNVNGNYYNHDVVN